MAEMNKKDSEFSDSIEFKNNASAENNGRSKRKPVEKKKEKGTAKKYKGNGIFESETESDDSLQIHDENSSDSEEETSPPPFTWKENKYGKQEGGRKDYGPYKGSGGQYRKFIDNTQKGVFANEKVFWKIAKPKMSYTLYSCRSCCDINFKKKEFAVKNGRLVMQLSFCPECTRMNMDVTDSFMKNIAAKAKSNGNV